MGVVEQEGHRATDRCTGPEPVELGVEQGRAGAQRGPEALFLAAHDVAHEVVLGDQLGIGLTHDGDRGVDQPGGDEVGDVEQVGLAHGPPDDAAQHVAPTLVGGEDPVGHEERHGAGVLGEDAQRRVGAIGHPEAMAGDPLRRLDEGGQHVGVEHRVDALEDREDPFEPGAGVDVLAGQFGVDALEAAAVLHEHQVPDLEEPLVATGGRPAVGPVGGALVDEDLRTRPAGTGRPPGRAPPVVGVEALDAVGAHADDVTPDLLGLVVGDVHGDPETIGVEAEQLGDHLPRHRDGLGLEVVAEAEVAEHLEEGQVAGVPADLLEVGVLAAGADALLDGGGPGVRGRLLAEEVGLERHHAGHGEHEVGIVGDEAGRGHDGVAALGEEPLEGSSQLVGGHGGHGPQSLRGACDTPSLPPVHVTPRPDEAQPRRAQSATARRGPARRGGVARPGGAPLGRRR